MLLGINDDLDSLDHWNIYSSNSCENTACFNADSIGHDRCLLTLCGIYDCDARICLIIAEIIYLTKYL